MTLQSSFPAMDQPSADDFQSMLDILNALNDVPAPAHTASNGDPSSGSTEVRDTVLGTYSFTVPAAANTWRYEAVYNGALMSGTAGELYAFRIRDGGASTPTSSSTLVANSQIEINTTGGPGQQTVITQGTWVPGAGVHTLGVFTVRVNGVGAATPVTPTAGPDRELFVRFQGTS